MIGPTLRIAHTYGYYPNDDDNFIETNSEWRGKINSEVVYFSQFSLFTVFWKVHKRRKR